MMTLFSEGLFTYLSNGGTSAGMRIYPNTLPQGVTLPAIRYTLVSNPSEHTHSGPSSLKNPKYQFDCVADGDEGYRDAHILAEEVIVLLDGYRGPIGAFTCQAGFQDAERDDYDPETGRHAVQVDVIIWHHKI